MLTFLPPVAGNRAGIGPGRGTRTIVRNRGSGELPGVITLQLVTKQVEVTTGAHNTAVGYGAGIHNTAVGNPNNCSG